MTQTLSLLGPSWWGTKTLPSYTVLQVPGIFPLHQHLDEPYLLWDLGACPPKHTLTRTDCPTRWVTLTPSFLSTVGVKRPTLFQHPNMPEKFGVKQPGHQCYLAVDWDLRIHVSWHRSNQAARPSAKYIDCPRHQLPSLFTRSPSLSTRLPCSVIKTPIPGPSSDNQA